MMTELVKHATRPSLHLCSFDYEAGFDAADEGILVLMGVAAAPYVELCFEDIRYAVAHANWRWVASLAQTLKCMAGYFGAQPVSDAAGQIERACKTGTDGTIGDLMALLSEEMKRFAPVLRRRMLEDVRLRGNLPAQCQAPLPAMLMAQRR
jgi:hypothetical protein